MGQRETTERDVLGLRQLSWLKRHSTKAPRGTRTGPLSPQKHVSASLCSLPTLCLFEGTWTLLPHNPLPTALCCAQ